MENYYKNIDTNDCILFHGSKKGIEGKIIPTHNETESNDFGQGFYIGTKELQTLSRVTNEPHPYAYQLKISDAYINPDNCISLGIEDWVYFVLYNRKKLEDLSDTKFYQKYQHLADGKDFIIGAIADDVYDLCINDFCSGNITDYTFKQLIDCFDYGTQIVAKTQRACDVIQIVSEKPISKEEKKEIINARKMTKRDRIAYYQEKKEELNTLRKGLFFSEIKNQIREKDKDLDISFGKATINAKESEFQNIVFPSQIHEMEDIGHDLF